MATGQEAIPPQQHKTGGSGEQPGRSELLLRRSHSTSTGRQHSPRLVSGHHPSLSVDFVSQHLIELGSSTRARPDPDACTCNNRRVKATPVPGRWSRARAGIFRRKRRSLDLMGRTRSADGSQQVPEEKESADTAMQLQGETLEKDDDSRLVPAADCSREEVKFIVNRGMVTGSSSAERHTSTSGVEQPQGWCRPGLSHEYQPKVFEELIGHEMIVKALTNAIQSRRISPLYLFHGPGGTGKTSAAKIFGIALNCESTSPSKPCRSCMGCSRSLYTAELCSGNRTSGFANIKTLLQSTAFKQTFPGFKVFIIDECHSLSDDSWGELLDIIEREKGRGSLVFIVIAEDVNTVPRAVSSRCQKFSFAKLKDTDIVLKLARIVAREGIESRNDALKLIAKKVEGDLREAESLLDQLALLGQTITAPMVQQLVSSWSLVPL